MNCFFIRSKKQFKSYNIYFLFFVAVLCLKQGSDIMQLSIITDQINQDFETALQIIHEHGYKYIEIHNVFSKSIEECNDKEVKKIKELVQRYEVKVTNIASTIFFLCPLYENDQVTLFNPEFYSIKGNVHTHLRYLENACKIALELDFKRIRVFPFRWPDNRKPPFGTKEDMKIILNNLLLAEKIARNYGITLVLENCPYSHLPKGKMSLQLVQQINSPYLKLLWDPANSYRAFKQNVPLEYQGITLIEELKEVYPYIDHIHVKDYHYVEGFKKPFVHKPIYDGDIDYDSIFAYLKEQGYDKALSLEPEVSHKEALLCMKRLQEKTK